MCFWSLRRTRGYRLLLCASNSNSPINFIIYSASLDRKALCLESKGSFEQLHAGWSWLHRHRKTQPKLLLYFTSTIPLKWESCFHNVVPCSRAVATKYSRHALESTTFILCLRPARSWYPSPRESPTSSQWVEQESTRFDLGT